MNPKRFFIKVFFEQETIQVSGFKNANY